MLGTVVNAAAIVAGSAIGLLLGKGMPERVKCTLTQGVGLAVLLVGFSMALQTRQILVVIVSIVLGGLTGELLDIEGRLARLGRWLESKAGTGAGEVGKAFVTASLVYCIGAMAIVGSIEDGINKNPQILFTKAALDGISSVVLASTMGVGIIFSSFPVFVYQGSITLLAVLVKDLLSEAAVAEMTATGGLLIVGIALNILSIKEIKTGNLLPSVFYAVPLTMLFSALLPS
ncbi:MAG TPA: DUF554 domain-containing protein [Bacillota bacterium]|nr:DUF554 domain-containing protein [Bacillota bacterium]